MNQTFRIAGTMIAVVLLSSLAAADRFVTIPIGKKIPYRAVKLQHLFDGVNLDRVQTTLGLGIGTSLEAEISYEDIPGSRRKTTLDLAYSLTDPLVDLGPGISFGVRDVANETSTGRYGYFVITWQEGMIGEKNQETPAEASFGLKYGRERLRPFAGSLVPITNEVLIAAEFESLRLSGGLEVRPVKGATLRWMHRQKQSFWTVGYLQRF